MTPLWLRANRVGVDGKRASEILRSASGTPDRLTADDVLSASEEVGIAAADVHTAAARAQPLRELHAGERRGVEERVLAGLPSEAMADRVAAALSARFDGKVVRSIIGDSHQIKLQEAALPVDKVAVTLIPDAGGCRMIVRLEGSHGLVGMVPAIVAVTMCGSLTAFLAIMGEGSSAARAGALTIAALLFGVFFSRRTGAKNRRAVEALADQLELTIAAPGPE